MNQVSILFEREPNRLLACNASQTAFCTESSYECNPERSWRSPRPPPRWFLSPAHRPESANATWLHVQPTTHTKKTIAKNRGRFADLRVKRAAIVQNVVRTPNAAENLIHRPDFASRSGDETAHLAENHAQRDGAKQRGFASHVWSGDDAGANSLLAYEQGGGEGAQSMWRELGMNVLPCFCFIIMSSTTRWRTSVSDSVEATRERGAKSKQALIVGRT